MTNYSDRIKEAMVKRMIGENAISSSALYRETGIAQSTLSKWLRIYSKRDKIMSMKKKTSSEKWKDKEKFNAVMEYEKLSEEKQGLYLRKKGLHESHIIAWKKDMIKGLKPDKSLKKGDNNLIRELQKDIRKKDKALAEVTALLILKKKADLLFGDLEE